MTQGINRNPRLLFWGRVLLEVKLLSAIIVLFYLHRGLTLNEVFLMSVIWSATSLLLEVPSGYLADRIGRKSTMLLGTALMIIFYMVTFVAQGFWWFAASFVIISASYACFSGTREAILFESLLEMGEASDMNTHNGKQRAAHSLPAVFMPMLGALLAHDLSEAQFQLLVGLNLLFMVAAFVVFTFLIEPNRSHSVAQAEKGIFTESLETIKEDPWLLKVALNKFIFFMAIFIAWRISQPYLKQHGFDAVALGLFCVFFQGLEFLASWFAGVVEKRLGTATIVAMTPVITSVALIIILMTQTPWLSFFLLGIAIASNALREPVFAHAVNHRIKSHSRATTLSNMNLIKGVFDIPILLLAGWLSGQSLEYTFMFSIGLSLMVLVLFPIHARELRKTNV